jgi:hypothetical protein
VVFDVLELEVFGHVSIQVARRLSSSSTTVSLRTRSRLGLGRAVAVTAVAPFKSESGVALEKEGCCGMRVGHRGRDDEREAQSLLVSCLSTWIIFLPVVYGVAH